MANWIAKNSPTIVPWSSGTISSRGTKDEVRSYFRMNLPLVEDRAKAVFSSEETHKLVSDIDTVVVNSLQVLVSKRLVSEAKIVR
jgi:hypothetical protein